MVKSSKKQRQLRGNRKKISKAELPSLRSFWERWHLRRCVGVVVLVLVISLSVMALNRLLTVEHWNIDAPEQVKADINRWLHQQPLDFWHARPVVLRQKILHKMPDVADVLLQRKLPHQLDIRVQMRQPLALWEDAQGVLHLVDGQGVVYRAIHHNEYVDLPLLRMPKTQVHAASRVLAAMKFADDARWAEVSEVMMETTGWRIDFSHQEQWLLPFGEKAVHNTALLAQMLQSEPWSVGRWRIQSRLNDRWFFRLAEQKRGHPVGKG